MWERPGLPCAGCSYRARLTPAAKREHLWERGFEVGQKILHRQRMRGEEVGSSHLNTKLKAGGG